MPFESGPRARIENLVVEIDVLDIEGDVLLRFPVDGLGQLRLGHDGKADLLDDDRIPREGRRDFLRLERLVLEEAADGVGDGGSVDDGAVHDAVGRHRLDGERRDLEAFARRLQLDRLDGAGADVETDDGFRFPETKHL